MKGFALPRQFRQNSLAESLSRNMRELVSFLNSYVVRFESDGSTLILPGRVEGQEVAYHTPGGGDGHLGYSDGDNYLTHDSVGKTRFRSYNGSYTNVADIDDDGLLLASGKTIRSTGVGASMYRTGADQSISSGVATVLGLNAIAFDTSPDSDLADSANSRFVIPTGFGGLWAYTVETSWGGGTPPTDVYVRPRVNTSPGGLHRNGSVSTYDGIGGSGLLNVSAGDTVDFLVTMNANFHVRGSNTYTFATLHKVA